MDGIFATTSSCPITTDGIGRSFFTHHSSGRCMAAASCSFSQCRLTFNDDGRGRRSCESSRDERRLTKWAKFSNGLEALDRNASLMTWSTCDMSSGRIGGNGPASYRAHTGSFKRRQPNWHEAKAGRRREPRQPNELTHGPASRLRGTYEADVRAPGQRGRGPRVQSPARRQT